MKFSHFSARSGQGQSVALASCRPFLGVNFSGADKPHAEIMEPIKPDGGFERLSSCTLPFRTAAINYRHRLELPIKATFSRCCVECACIANRRFFDWLRIPRAPFPLDIRIGPFTNVKGFASVHLRHFRSNWRHTDSTRLASLSVGRRVPDDEINKDNDAPISVDCRSNAHAGS